MPCNEDLDQAERVSTVNIVTPRRRQPRRPATIHGALGTGNTTRRATAATTARTGDACDHSIALCRPVIEALDRTISTTTVRTTGTVRLFVARVASVVVGSLRPKRLPLPRQKTNEHFEQSGTLVRPARPTWWGNGTF